MGELTYLKYITRFESNSGLSTWYKIIFKWVIVELRPHKYLEGK